MRLGVVPSVPDGGFKSSISERWYYTGMGVQNEVDGCPKWLFGRVMLRHNRDRKTVATERTPPRESKNTMKEGYPKCV
jgi:hypothetical protein